MNDRWVLQTVNSPERAVQHGGDGDPRLVAHPRPGWREPVNHIGTPARSAGSRTTRHETTG